MSEKDKKEKKQPQQEAPAEETAAENAASAEEAAAEETFTVTKSQMEQMEQLAKVLAEAKAEFAAMQAEADNKEE